MSPARRPLIMLRTICYCEPVRGRIGDWVLNCVRGEVCCVVTTEYNLLQLGDKLTLLSYRHHSRP